MTPSAPESEIAAVERRGARWPAEWEPHRATWLAWPHNRGDWPGKLAAIHWVFVEIVRWLVPGERVEVLVEDVALERRARKKLADGGVDLSRVGFHRVPTDRAWLRDSGPVFVHGEDGEVRALDWHFNAWARYPTWKLDDRVAGRIAEIRGVEAIRPHAPGDASRRIVLEGGAIDGDGAGTLLATEECLVSEVQARNPGLGREALEAVLAGALGIRRFLWLEAGLVGDDTHGHVDVIARFVAPGHVVHAVEEDGRDPNHGPLEANRQRLESARDAGGQALRLTPLPMPRPLEYLGKRLPATYLNFYIGNRVVLVPTYNDPADRVALERLAELFPDREVVGIHSVDLVAGQGAIHCLSQQEPAPATGSPEERD